MKRTMYQAARHTPKRQAVGSNPAGRAMNTDISWYKKTRRLRRVFCYTCKSVNESRVNGFSLQEHTNGLALTFSAIQRCF